MVKKRQLEYKEDKNSDISNSASNTKMIKIPETDEKVAHKWFIFHVFGPVPRNEEHIVEYDDDDDRVLTKLELYNPWKIKKILTTSDVSRSQSRLLVPIHLAETHIVLYIWHGFGHNLHGGGVGRDAAEVKCWDADTNTNHVLVFTRWSSRSYLFTGGWSDEFVERRKLMKGDEIGLFWEEGHLRFNFCVLSRVARSSTSAN